MSILFQYPALLGLLALAGLPWLVHLLSRAKPAEYRFSNIEFLRRVSRLTARFRRPQDWLLLALRTLALLLLAAAFALPLLISKNAALPGEKSTVVLLIDRSASMAARDEATGSRFEIACAQAAKYLDSIKPDKANIVWIDAEPDAAFPEPGPNLRFLTDQLKQAEPKQEAGALAAAFDLALRQYANAKGRRELLVISDFQASAWADFKPALPKDLILRSERVATAAPPNLAVTRLLCQPTEPVVGQEITLLVNVRSFSPEPNRPQLTLNADGARQSQAVNLSAWGEAEVAFKWKPVSAGAMPVTVSIESDGFPGDDARHSVVRVRSAIRIAGATQDAVHRVIANLPWLESSEKAASGDIQIVPAWSGADLASLRAKAESGVTVLIHSPTGFPSDLAALGTASTLTPESSVDGWQILPDESHPAVQLFRSGDFGNPFAGKFRERLPLPPLADAKLIASYGDGVPAIFEIPTSGASILFFNLSLDPKKSDWTGKSVFLPAFAEILLRTQPSGRSEPSQLMSGTVLRYISTEPEQVNAVSLVGPASQPIEIRESTTAQGTLWQSLDASSPGMHQWQISGQTIEFAAINFPASESDLRPLAKAPAFGKDQASSDSLERLAALARGVPLWPWLVLAALMLLATESLIHSRSVAS